MLSFFSFETEKIWSPEFIIVNPQGSRDPLLNFLLTSFHAVKSCLHFQRNADSKLPKRLSEKISTFSVSMATVYPRDLSRCLLHRPINLIMGQISLQGWQTVSGLLSSPAWEEFFTFLALAESQVHCEPRCGKKNKDI